MRNFLSFASAFALTALASAAAAAPPTPPAYAAPLFDAYFNIAVGHGWNSFDGSGLPISIDNSGFAVSGRATFEAAISDRFGAQVDGVLGYDANALKAGGASFDDPATIATLAGHAFWRDPNVGLIGAIGQYTSQATKVDESTFTLSVDDTNYYAGVEGQYFLNNVTLYAQAAYHGKTVGIATTSFDGDGFTLAGQVRYFVMPDWSIAAKGSFDSVSFDLPSVFTTKLEETIWKIGPNS